MQNKNGLQHAHSFIFLSIFAILSFLLMSCASGKTKLEVPPDAPEICKDVDFDLHKDLRDMCGVQARNYRAYKNVVEYRMLSRPKDGQVVKKGNLLELRLPKMQPISLPSDLKDQIAFSEKDRRELLKTQWDYTEFFPKGSTDKIKMMKIIIPHLDGNHTDVCYEIESRPSKVSDIQAGYASKLNSLSCNKYDQLKLQSDGQ